MCETCGCGDSPSHEHTHVLGHEHTHIHKHDHGHADRGELAHAHNHSSPKISIDVDILSVNNDYARRNREFFKRTGIYAVNIIGSPGCGKTTLVEALAKRFQDAMAVVEGDIQTRRDAERVIRAGSRAWQIETNGACHLDAHGVGHAIEHLDLTGCKLLVIENVGNLVCPSTYDLGEHEKIAVLSLPEGDDKVLKYPALFHRIGALIFNKIDLAPHLDFDIQKAINECRSLNRSFSVFQISAKTGQGMEEFCAYLTKKAGIGTFNQ